IATYARNLLLNWLVLIPLLMAVLLMPQIGMALVAVSPVDNVTKFLLQQARAPSWSVFGYGVTPDWLAFGLGGLALLTAMAFVGYNGPYAMQARGRKLRGQVAFLCWCLLPVMIAAICFSLSWAWFSRRGLEASYFSIYRFAIAGAGLRALAWLFSLPI